MRVQAPLQSIRLWSSMLEGLGNRHLLDHLRGTTASNASSCLVICVEEALATRMLIQKEDIAS